MTGFDYIVFLVVGLAAIAGFFRGFVEEVLSLAAWCVALLAVHYGHAALTGMLTPHVGGETAAGVLAFIVLLAVPYFGTKLIARQMGSASRGSMLGPIDRVLGFGFGAVKGFIITVLAFSLVVFAYDMVWGPKGRPAWIRDGRTYQFLNASSDELLTLVSKRRQSAVEADDSASEPATDDPTPVHHSHRRRHKVDDGE
jgi:membrane protein required for colicin V production